MNDDNEHEGPVLTIVGGQPRRPLVGGQIGRRDKFAQKIQVPVGLEKVLYLAARDPALEEMLLADRDKAVAALGLELRPSEKAMLDAAPNAVLEAMIGSIETKNTRKRKFMGLVAAAAASLAAGTASVGCDDMDHIATMGVGPDVDAGQDADVVDTDTDTNLDGGARSDIPAEE